MSRSGYADFDGWDDDNSGYLYMGTVARTMNGKRGQAFLRELRDTLEAMPEKRLIADELKTAEGAVCAIGSVGVARGVDMSNIDPEDARTVGKEFGISPTMAREIVSENDGDFRGRVDETPEQRYYRVLYWVKEHIRA